MVITRQFAPLSMYRNDAKEKNWVGLQLYGNGRHCNSNAIGTRVEVSDSRGGRQIRDVQASNGLSAQGDSRLLFGLGSNPDKVDVRIFWCGQRDAEIFELSPGKYHNVRQQS